MAETMKTILFTSLLLAGAAHAQVVQDPTRPPAQWSRPASGAPDVQAPQLQSILIGRAPGGRRVAVIDGNTVRVGDSVGGARVTAMTQDAVTLARGSQRTVLKLKAAGATRAAPIAPAVAPAVVPPSAPAAAPVAAPIAAPALGRPE